MKARAAYPVMDARLEAGQNDPIKDGLEEL
jgi:hypothetical protein